jgi:hypothetical protein
VYPCQRRGRVPSTAAVPGPRPIAAIKNEGISGIIKWPSTGIPDGTKLIGAGMKSIKAPGRAADNGAKVFAGMCATARTD